MNTSFLSRPKKQKSSRMIINRSDFISSLFKTDAGMPFLFKGREYLKTIYNYSYRYVVLLASRQAEKSTLLSKDMLSDGILNANDSLLYVTAQQRQADEFVHRKINRQFDLNPSLEHDYLGPGSINNIRDKILSNGTTFAFRAIGQNADSARGIPARKIYFDEVQSILSDNIPIVTECAQSFPHNSAYAFAGTPLSTKNVLSQKFYETKQYEWLITCNHCDHINPPLGMEHIDISRPFLFCLKCGKDMEAQNGTWVAMNPESKLAGFRISRLMTPTCTWRTPANDGVLDKLETYSESSFYQEVLGLPYDAGNLPITEEEVYACCEDYEFIDPSKLNPGFQSQLLFAGIDWAWNTQEGGQAFTILTLARLHGSRIEIVYAKRFHGPQYHNPSTVLSEISQICNTLGVKVIGTDFGIGHKENLRLKEMVTARVFEMLYTSSGTEFSWDSEAECYKLGRTVILDLVFNRLKKGLYRFPKRSVIQPFATDILNVYAEYDPNWKRLKYEHAGTGPDDFLHCLAYLSLIIEVYHSIRIR
ncbi:MAG: hypothetical protein HN590_11960 [Calditrichaeota bacterium]|nr:hypothetical protein [Calditrichota bacterium]